MLWSLMVVAVTAAGTADASERFVEQFTTLDECRSFYQETYKDLPVNVLHAICYDQARYSFVTDTIVSYARQAEPTS